MTAVDDVRRRLRLTLEQLAGLAAAAAGHDPGPAGPSLHAAGVLTPDGPVPLAADLALCLRRPTLRLLVEAFGPQGPTVAEVVVSGEDVWSTDPWAGEPGDAATVWQRTDLQTLLWDLARLVGLRRAVPFDLPPVTADVGSLDGVLGALAASDAEHFEAVRTGIVVRTPERLAHLPEADRQALQVLLANLQAGWRITCFWGDPDAAGGARGLAVLDAGPLGYWRRTAPAEPMTVADLAPATPVRLEPADTAQLWRGLADLLPSSEELRRAADAAAPEVVPEPAT